MKKIDKHQNLKITHKHLERLLTSQEYFVWNWNITDELENDDEGSNVDYYWEIFSDCDLDELNDYKYVEVIKSAFNLVNKLFVEYVEKWAKRENKKLAIINERNNELAFKKTIEIMNQKDIDWILNPVFIYEDMISKPSLFMKDRKHIFSLVNSTKTKLKNYIKAYFDYSICKKLNIEINEYYFFYYDSNKEYTKPKELSFLYSPYCWTQKNGPGKNIGHSISENCLNETIIMKLNKGVITYKGKNDPKPHVLLKLEDFDYYVEKIRNAKLINEAPKSLTYEDYTPWGENPYLVKLFDYSKYNLKPVSGLLIKKNEMIELEYGEKSIEDLIKKHKNLKYVINKKNFFNKEIIKEYIDQIEKKDIVWYDFEGFFMPTTILPFSKPYIQQVFQVSVIKTSSEEIVSSKNIVIDPKNIKVSDFETIINEIYWSKAHKYVVFNKGYELKRIKEMIDLMKLNKFEQEKIKDLEYKFTKIKEKTLDLQDLFLTNASNHSAIFISDLCGFYSIKKIENYITENKFNLKIMIKPYKELEIQNGVMAMNKAIQRYLGSIGDKEWEKVAENLKKYCENDVKAMIMVYFYIKFVYFNY